MNRPEVAHEMGGVREGSGSAWHPARVTGSEEGHWQPCSSPSNSWEALFGRMAGSIRPCCGTLLAAASNRLQSAAWGAGLAGQHEDGEQSLGPTAVKEVCDEGSGFVPLRAQGVGGCGQGLEGEGSPGAGTGTGPPHAMLTGRRADARLSWFPLRYRKRAV